MLDTLQRQRSEVIQFEVVPCQTSGEIGDHHGAWLRDRL